VEVIKPATCSEQLSKYDGERGCEVVISASLKTEEVGTSKISEQAKL
jgi:hypothetical protein